VPDELFNRRLRVLHRDRAARIGPELFLLDRAFDDCLDRLTDIARPFSDALLLGCPSPDWPAKLGSVAQAVDVVDPGELFAMQAGGPRIDEDRHDFGEQRYDLCVAIGTLDTVNELPLALHLLHRSLRPDGLLIGAIAGGDSLSTLRTALIEAERAGGRIAARTHPRISAPSLAQLLTAAGFEMPVVDVDRVRLRYRDLHSLIRDLRAMAATNSLAERRPYLSRSVARRADQAFQALGNEGRTDEFIEILHFLGWGQ
jgi:NADH dehydrogenase [ubiquinone] 1 alpha subcomplex assembly factor 5